MSKELLQQAVSGATGKTYLCRAWGETDLTLAAIVVGLDGVQAFLAEYWLGSDDHTDDDGTETLPSVMADIQKCLAGSDDGWSLEFEIGGISVETVDAVAVSRLVQPVQPTTPSRCAAPENATIVMKWLDANCKRVGWTIETATYSITDAQAFALANLFTISQPVQPSATPPVADLTKIEKHCISNAGLCCFGAIKNAYRLFHTQGKTEKDFDECAWEAMVKAVKYAVDLTAREVRDPVWPYVAEDQPATTHTQPAPVAQAEPPKWEVKEAKSDWRSILQSDFGLYQSLCRKMPDRYQMRIIETPNANSCDGEQAKGGAA